ncbi:hypothetical protein, partial [Roseobacter sp. HKCCA0434]|uniref:hypothetical protein n=1 Tax=Roseobacter sp. HKCCA0434 TaxID=3079297 RepID=UPI002905F5BD
MTVIRVAICALPLLGACAPGESLGFYDLPEGMSELTEAQPGPYPDLLTQEQIAMAGFAPLDAAARGRADAETVSLQERAGALLEDEAARLEARAGTLRRDADGLPVRSPGLTAQGRNLLA